jgi:hypothetical protein
MLVVHCQTTETGGMSSDLLYTATYYYTLALMQLLGVFNIALLQHLTWNGSINLQIFSENEKDNYRT